MRDKRIAVHFVGVRTATEIIFVPVFWIWRRNDVINTRKQVAGFCNDKCGQRYESNRDATRNHDTKMMFIFVIRKPTNVTSVAGNICMLCCSTLSCQGLACFSWLIWESEMSTWENHTWSFWNTQHGQLCQEDRQTMKQKEHTPKMISILICFSSNF